MRLQDTLFKIGIGVSLSLGSFTPALASDDYNCTQLMYEHGLATSAQLHCKYDQYNEAVIIKAAQCMKLSEKYGESKQLEDALRDGLSDFQTQYEEASDKEGICSEFSDQFSMFVKP